MIKLGHSYIDIDGNWKFHTKKDMGVFTWYYNKVESLKTSIDNRATNYFPFYEDLVSLYSKSNQSLNKFLYSRYIPSGINGDNEYVIKDTKYNRLYLLSNKTNDDIEKRSSGLIEFYNSLSENINSDIYIYLPSRYEFQKSLNKGMKYRDMSKYIDKFTANVEGITIKELFVNSEKVYHDYFFASDHHWNMQGAYNGYTDIMDMMNIKDYNRAKEIFKVNTINFRGSLSNCIKSKEIYDYLYDVDFNMLEHTVTVNDDEAPEKYKPRSIVGLNKNDTPFYDYYIGYYYGLYGKVVYDFNQPEKPNILIIADSFSWSIDHLIASNFNKTHIINLMYDEFKDKSFNIREYTEKNNISIILFLQETHTTILDLYDHNISERVVW